MDALVGLVTDHAFLEKGFEFLRKRGLALAMIFPGSSIGRDGVA